MVIFLNKKFVILNTILTFIVGFFVHGIYNWLPNTITSIFPINESLFEHMKLIYYSPIISSLILYFLFRRKNYYINNYLFGLIVSIIFNIIIFYLVYLPIYYEMGESLVMTLIIYFITIILSNYLYYLIVEMSYSKKLSKISFIMIIVIGGILTYFTYHPLKIDFFKDPNTNNYGISN